MAVRSRLRKLINGIRPLCKSSPSMVTQPSDPFRPSPMPFVLKLDGRKSLSVVCMGAKGDSKCYTIALHSLRNPRLLLQMLADTALGICFNGALAIDLEPHTFEAIFCLFQRSCVGLTPINPLPPTDTCTK